MQAINVGQVYRYITKPWKKEELNITIDKALETYRLRKENQMLIQNLKDKNKALQQSEEKFSKAFYISPMAICIVRVADNLITDFNQNFANLIGMSKEELWSKTFDDLACWPEDTEQERLVNCLQHEGKLVNFEHEFLGGNEENRIVRTSTELIKIRDEEHYLFLFNDITEQRKTEDRILQATLETEDRERSRIAGEIHDTLGQNLTVASLNFEMTGKSLLKKGDERIFQMYKKGQQYLDKAIRESRNIAHNLMPTIVKDFGYVAAVESMLEALNDWEELGVNFYHNLDGRLPPSLEYQLYRITQEALNNALKHADAHKITLQLIRHSDRIIFTFEDDGKGFVPKDQAKSFGLNGMHSRAKSLSGTFTIDSALQRGTTITIQIPVEPTLQTSIQSSEAH